MKDIWQRRDVREAFRPADFLMASERFEPLHASSLPEPYAQDPSG